MSGIKEKLKKNTDILDFPTPRPPDQPAVKVQVDSPSSTQSLKFFFFFFSISLSTDPRNTSNLRKTFNVEERDQNKQDKSNLEETDTVQGVFKNIFCFQRDKKTFVYP